MIKLTAREEEVLTLVGEGMRNAEIAATLYIADDTVRCHVAKILKKTGAKNRYKAYLKYSEVLDNDT